MRRCTLLRKSCLYPILLMLVPPRNVHFHGTCLENSFRSLYVHTLETPAGQQSPLICAPGLPSLFYTHSALPRWSSSSGGWRCFQTSPEAAKIKKHVPENELSVTSEISPYPSLGPLLFSDLWCTFIQRSSADLWPLSLQCNSSEQYQAAAVAGINALVVEKFRIHLSWPNCCHEHCTFYFAKNLLGDFQRLHAQ